MENSHTVLVLNPGSATLKYTLFQVEKKHVGQTESVLEQGAVERVGEPGQPATVAEAAARLIPDLLRKHVLQAPTAVACRVVMGGTDLTEPTPVTPEVIARIRALAPLAPLHNPPAALTLDTIARLLPETPIYAVFDTAFHATLPPIAFTYAVPQELCQQEGLRRFGFHGIAHRWVCGRLRERLSVLGRPHSRCITCHLGSGASVCAIRDGISVDTSMGMTPMEGLVMGTRSGDIDPGVLLYLLHARGWTAGSLEDMLNKKSGLLGVSGLSNDLRDLEKASGEGNRDAALAIELFAYRVTRYIGAYAAVLGGLDALAFSGGIGENSAPMREHICRSLGFLGIELDSERNRQSNVAGGMACISPEHSETPVWIVAAEETRQIVREIMPYLPDGAAG